MRSTPLFIVFEGPDGAGKSTLAAALADALQTTTWSTAEPTRGPFGLAARQRLHDAARLENEATSLTPDLAARSVQLRRAEALGLFLADRLAHLDDIAAHLAAGETVLCDRYALSTWAYQGQALSPDPHATLKLCMQGVRAPDLTVLMLAPEAVLLERVGARNHADPVEVEVQVRRHAQAYRTFADSLRLFAGLRSEADPGALHPDSDFRGAFLLRHPIAPGPFLLVPWTQSIPQNVRCITDALAAITQRRRGMPANDLPRGEFE